MKIVVFNGSPKAKNSNTSVIATAFLDGAQKAGALTEEIYLIEKDIHHCTGCFHCWFKTPGKCIFRDDMDALLEKYTDADIVCFATPVYTWNMTAALKNFVDRLAPLKSPLLQHDNGDYDLADTDVKTAKFVVVANAGFPGENNFGTISQVFSSCHPVLEIYRNCGMALKKDDSRIKDYLETVSDSGFELASRGSVTSNTKEKLNRDLMPVEEYVRMIGM